MDSFTVKLSIVFAHDAKQDKIGKLIIQSTAMAVSERDLVGSEYYYDILYHVLGPQVALISF